MKTILRGLTLAMLSLYLGLIANEAFHGFFLKSHAEASCVVCQVAHQTPVLQSASPIFSAPNLKAQTLASFVAPSSQAPAPLVRGRSPPLL